MRTAVLALLLAASAMGVSGETKSQAQDFETLRQFGLPDVTGAKRVWADLSWRGTSGTLMSGCSRSGDAAWLLRENPDGSAELVLFDSWRVKATRRGAAASGVGLEGSWRPMDSADWLRRMFDAPGGRRQPSESGRLLLLAAQVQQMGLVDEASRLATMSAGMGGDRKTALDAALCRLAAARCCELFVRCAQDGDFTSFSQGADDLLRRCPPDLELRPALEKLSQQLHQLLKGGAPAELSGDGLTDTDRSQAQALAVLPVGAMGRSVAFWMFPPSPDGRSEGTPFASLPPALRDILKRRLDAIPQLLALRDDQTPTKLLRFPNAFLLFVVGRRLDFMGRETDVGPAAWGLPGPATRGDIANACLATVPPNGSGFHSCKAAPVEIARWFRDNRGKSLRELALLYLRRGNSEQRRGALEYVLETKDMNTLATVERLLLSEAKEQCTDYNLAITYVWLRRAAAKGFVEAIAQYAPPSVLDQMRGMVSGRSLDDLAAGLAAGAVAWDGQVAYELRLELKKRPDPTRAALELALRLPGHELRRRCLALDAPLAPRPYPADAGLWGKLHADVGQDSPYQEFLDQRLIGLYAPDSRPDGNLASQLGRAMVKRHEAALAASIRSGGSPLPRPAAVNVPPERRAQLVHDLERSSPADLPGLLGKLSLDEVLAAKDILAGDRCLNAKFLPFANTIVEVAVDSPFGNKFDALKFLKGQELSRASLAALPRAFHANPGLSTRIEVSRDACLGGVRVKFSVPAHVPGSVPNGVGQVDTQLAVGGSPVGVPSQWYYKIEERGGQNRAVAITLPNPKWRNGIPPESAFDQVDSALAAAPALLCFRLDFSVLAPPPSPPPVDVVKEFERLRQFGMPDVAGAKRVDATLAWRGVPNGSLGCRDGDAWLLEERPDGSAAMILFDGWRARVEKTNWNSKPERSGMGLKGSWRPVDFKAELQKTLRLAETELGPFGFGNRYGGIDSKAKLFLVAAHAHQLGMKDDAARLAELLCKSEDTPKKLFDAALCRLAAAKCCELFANYAQDGNLAAFSQGVEALRARCPKGRPIAPCLKVLAGQLDQRLKGVAAPGLVGERLGDTDRAQAKALADAKGGCVPQSYDFWLFPTPGLDSGYTVPPPPELADILKRKLDAVPLLLALRDDPFPTSVLRLPDCVGLFEFGFMAGRNPLPRLASRGDLAEAALWSLIPRRQGDFPAPSVWFEDNRTKPLAQLAMLYLKDGNQGQQFGALAFLARNGSDTELKELERVLLEGFDDQSPIPVACEYVRLRLSGAKNFVEAFAARPGQSRSSAESLAAKMRQEIADQDLDYLVDCLASGKLKWDQPAETALARLLPPELARHPEPLRHLLELALRLPGNKAKQAALGHAAAVKGTSPKYQDTARLWERILVGAQRDQGFMQFLRRTLADLYGSDEIDQRLRLGVEAAKRAEEDRLAELSNRLFQAGLAYPSGAQFVQARLRCRDKACAKLFGDTGSSQPAWLLKQGEDGVASLALFNGLRLEARDCGKFREARDCPADALGISVELYRSDFKAKLRDLVRYAKSQQRGERATALLVAAQVFRLGFKEEACALASPLFETEGDVQVLLGAALDQLAACDCCEAFLRFAKDGDRSALANKLARLRQCLPAAKSRRELAATEPDLTSLADSDRATAKALAAATGVFAGVGAWVVRSPPNPPVDCELAPRLPPAWRDCLGRGLDCVPLLLALKDSPCPTGLAAPPASPNRFAAEIEAGRDPLPRFVTLGELAAAALTQIDSLRQGSDLRRWFEKNRGMSPEALALLYIRDGAGQGQRRGALAYFLRSPSKAELAELERQFLDALQQGRPDLPLVYQYVRARGAAANDFVDAYVKGTEELDRQQRFGYNPKSVAATLRQSLEESQSLESLVDGLASGKLKDESQVRISLRRQLERALEWRSDPLRLLLPLALRLPSHGLREWVLSMALWCDCGHPRLQDDAPLWDKLLADAWTDASHLEFLRQLFFALYARDEAKAFWDKAAAAAKQNGVDAARRDFALLFQAGLPDITKARRVQVDLRPFGTSGQIKGGAWLLGEDKEGGAELLLFDAWRIKAKAVDNPMNGDSGWDDKAGCAFYGRWSPGDFPAELREMTKAVEAGNSRNGGGYDTMRHYSELSVAAANASRLGMEAEALRLADALAQASHDSGLLLHAGLSRLATGNYFASYFRFVQDGDLHAFAVRLKALSRSCPKGWLHAPAVAETVRRLDQKFAGRVAALSGDELDDTDRHLAKALADAQGGTMRYMRFWLFPVSEHPGAYNSDYQSPPAVVDILSRNERAVPLLLALADDQCLTGIQGYFYGFAEAFEDRYPTDGANPLPGLATRGDIARECLRPLLPDYQPKWPPDPEATLAAQRSWWQKHRDESLRQLARLYLLEGDKDQHKDAFDWLLHGSESEAEWQDLELSIACAIAAERNNLPLLDSFVAWRGAKAKSFADTYACHVAALGDGKAKVPVDVVSAKLKALRTKPNLESFLDGMLSGKRQWDAAAEKEFWVAVREGGVPCGDPAGSLLRAALRTDDLALRLGLLKNVGELTAFDRRRLRFADHAALWRQLLDDPRGGQEYRQTLLERLLCRYASSEYHRLWEMRLDALPERRRELAEAILRHGQDFQDVLPVDATRRMELAKTMASLAPGDFRAFAIELRVEELLTIDSILAQDAATNRKLLPSANTIREVNLYPAVKDKLGELRQLVGQEFTPRIRERLLQVVEDNRQLGLLCSINRSACLGGVSILLRDAKESHCSRRQENGFEIEACLRSHGGQACLKCCEVVTKDGKECLLPAKRKYSQGIPPALFWRKVDAAFSGGPATGAAELWLQLYTDNVEKLP